MSLDSVVETLTRQLVAKLQFRVPVTIATVARNGSSIISKVDAGPNPGSVTFEHVTGDVGDEGLQFPLQLMAVDATGKVRVAVAGSGGPPRIYPPLGDAEELS